MTRESRSDSVETDGSLDMNLAVLDEDTRVSARGVKRSVQLISSASSTSSSSSSSAVNTSSSEGKDEGDEEEEASRRARQVARLAHSALLASEEDDDDVTEGEAATMNLNLSVLNDIDHSQPELGHQMMILPRIEREVTMDQDLHEPTIESLESIERVLEVGDEEQHHHIGHEDVDDCEDDLDMDLGDEDEDDDGVVGASGTMNFFARRTDSEEEEDDDGDSDDEEDDDEGK